MSKTCEYCHLIGGYGKFFWETDFWKIYLAPSQRYLGTCVVAIKRHCRDLSELNDQEWIDFGSVVQNLEKSVEKSFHPTLFNWSCFKNSVFRNENPDPEVHWHFIPRYKESVEYYGTQFTDPDFGFIPQPIKREIQEEIQDKIIQEIRKNLPIID